jgi:hypothetical protein
MTSWFPHWPFIHYGITIIALFIGVFLGILVIGIFSVAHESEVEKENRKLWGIIWDMQHPDPGESL